MILFGHVFTILPTTVKYIKHNESIPVTIVIRQHNVNATINPLFICLGGAFVIWYARINIRMAQLQVYPVSCVTPTLDSPWSGQASLPG